MMPHAATQILLWVVIAVVAQSIHTAPIMYLFTGVLLLLAFKLHAQRLFKLMYRTRWIFLSLLLIYAFATSGEALWAWDYAPTREGLQEGSMQLARLVCVLAGLSILLTLLSREQLISGIYVLLYPARYIGVSRERISVRLALTLHYAENAMRDTANDWSAAIENALTNGGGGADIELQLRYLGWLDVSLLMLGGAILIGIWL